VVFRYTDIKQDLEDELEGVRQEGAALENVSVGFLHLLSTSRLYWYRGVT
jgi:hypothetical protein